jgi:hypothetical protein
MITRFCVDEFGKVAADWIVGDAFDENASRAGSYLWLKSVKTRCPIDSSVILVHETIRMSHTPKSME